MTRSRRRSLAEAKLRAMRTAPPVLFLVLACSSSTAATQETNTAEKPASPKEDEKEKEKAPAPKSFTSSHSGTFHGTKVTYTATVGETILENDQHEPEATIWSTAYVKDGVTDPAERAVTFLWNGGPGSA